MASAVATRQAAVAIADIFLVAHDDDEKHHDAKEEDYQSAAEVIALHLRPHVEHVGRVVTGCHAEPRLFLRTCGTQRSSQPHNVS